MTAEERHNARQTLGHLKRLTREGRALLHDRPLDEWAHARWIERADRYLRRQIPGIDIPSALQLVPHRIPDLLDPNHEPPHPIDAAMGRCQHGRQLVEKYLVILARATEQLELNIELN